MVQAGVDDVFERAKKLMLDDFVEGSDPGLAVASSDQIDFSVVAFGLDAKRTVVDQKRARAVASNAGIRLEGLGGTEGGVIGAVAGLGLAHIRNDGRFLLKGKNREISGVQPVSAILESGVDRVMTLEGRAVLFVEEADAGYIALKRE
jgi:hypothetical protein